MSNAGIYSNRGDTYQTLIAFDWALTVLTDDKYQWLEIESTDHQVDDVVIGKTDGSVICCQCKKNQPNHKAWSVTDLQNELKKAFSALANNQQTQIYFYSRDSFGKLTQLREYSQICSDENNYIQQLGKGNTQTHKNLEKLISEQKIKISVFEFLHRTCFETTPDFDRLAERLLERLTQLVNNAKAAYHALLIELDKLGGRIENTSSLKTVSHRLTKEDLQNTLNEVGLMIVPVVSVQEAKKAFASTSAIGRSWMRTVAEQRIPNTVTKQIIDSIQGKKRSILLTGDPGSGKTCVMLDVQEKLEETAKTQTNLTPLFIQAREFADAATSHERSTQGLPSDWVEKAARLADRSHVVVVIDSLDVLSIAREHSVLTYFLSQIDRLLVIPNITVVTACRAFDRKYDRRIAVREWDKEFSCEPLDWNDQIIPLLNKLGIDLNTIDTVTRELITNPRELALFVDLAKHKGSGFSVFTSQELARKYLNTIIKEAPYLGDEAIQVIESIADEMLTSRSLSIPEQRFQGSDDLLRGLQSFNIIVVTHDGSITFGHQTLLDVLVISRALRQKKSLHEFIRNLPPVPFIRPSIRSFVAQLALGNRLEYRKQLRAVLTGKSAFHIRRLVAECYAQQVPHQEDWQLIRDLHNEHRDVFQALYLNASLVQWHQFWLDNLVPILKATKNADGMLRHVSRITTWINDDPDGVVAFWLEALQLDWLDTQHIAGQIEFRLPKIKIENLGYAQPLLSRIVDIDISIHSSLGETIARSVNANLASDELLWRYIAGHISNEEIRKNEFKDKLRCNTYDFGDKENNFLLHRMQHSTALLDLAFESIERWSEVRFGLHKGNRHSYLFGFLDETSFGRTHNKRIGINNAFALLLEAVEKAIINHAKQNSLWWRKYRQRLCFSHEGALVYFSILATTQHPQNNLNIISQLLSSKALLESELRFELGTLMHAAFIYLDYKTQDVVMSVIQSFKEKRIAKNIRHKSWVLKQRVEYISCIPCHLRSPVLQNTMDAYTKEYGSFIREPYLYIRSGYVADPFSYQVFIDGPDDAVLHLMTHYSRYDPFPSDDLVGGEQEVGRQLQEAASRQPLRFFRLLIQQWTAIPTAFRDSIVDGASNHLMYRYGNLGSSNQWEAIEKPDGQTLTLQMLDELERHPRHWQLTNTVAEALQACAGCIRDTQNASRLVFLAVRFGYTSEGDAITGDSVSLYSNGINMKAGKALQALLTTTNNLIDQNLTFPELLSPALSLFARYKHPAVRAVMLRRLPYLQEKNPELGWRLFDIAMQKPHKLWQDAESCMYHAYHNDFDRVSLILNRIYNAGSGKDLETWGRIAALCALSDKIEFSVALKDLHALDSVDAWQGASTVWVHAENMQKHSTQCINGLTGGLNTTQTSALIVAKNIGNYFGANNPCTHLPVEAIQLHLNILTHDKENERDGFYDIFKWLNTVAQHDPAYALDVVEIYAKHLHYRKKPIYAYGDDLTQLLTRLFAEAEEREEADQGTMLKRVVAVQDIMLALGIDSVNKWLSDAERP